MDLAAFGGEKHHVLRYNSITSAKYRNEYSRGRTDEKLSALLFIAAAMAKLPFRMRRFFAVDQDGDGAGCMGMKDPMMTLPVAWGALEDMFVRRTCHNKPMKQPSTESVGCKFRHGFA